MASEKNAERIVRVETLVNVPGSMIGDAGVPSRRVERGRKIMVTPEEAARLTAAGYAERIGGAKISSPKRASGKQTTKTSESEASNGDAYEEQTVEELQDLAKTLEITGYSSMNKAPLIEAIREAEAGAAEQKSDT